MPVEEEALIEDLLAEYEQKRDDLILEEIIKASDKILLKESGNTDYMQTKAWAYQELGNLPGAISVLNQVLEIEPESPDLHQNLATLKIECGDLESAIESLDKAIPLEPDNIHLYSSRGQIYFEKRYFDKALNDFNMVTKKDDNADYIHFLKFFAYQALGEKIKAEKELNRAISLNPCVFEYRMIRFKQNLRSNNLDGARKDLGFTYYIEHDNPKLHDALMSLGYQSFFKNRIDIYKDCKHFLGEINPFLASTLDNLILFDDSNPC